MMSRETIKPKTDNRIILFVDGDGVLNNFDLLFSMPTEKLKLKLYNQCSNAPVSPMVLGYLNKLCYDHPNIRLVFSSTWRLGDKKESLRCFKTAFNRLSRAANVGDIPYAIKFDTTDTESWRTPFNGNFNILRGIEIDEWLERYGTETTRYIILDDDNDFLPWQMPYYYNTHEIKGLTSNDYIELDTIIRTLEAPKQQRFDFTP